MLVAFLVGFFCQDHADEAYVHFAASRPSGATSASGATSTGASAPSRAPTAAPSCAPSRRRSTPAPSPSTRRSASPCCRATTRWTACRSPPSPARTATTSCTSSSSSSRRRRHERGPSTPAATGSAAGAPAGRITDAEALALLEGGDLLGAGARADAVRRRLHPGDEVTFIVDRNINYTDYCLSGCRFCAFYKKPGSGEGYLLAEEDIHRKIEETLELGGTAIMMQGGLHPDLDICWFEEVFSGIKAKYPIHIHSLSPPEIVHIAKQSDLSVEETLTRLHAAGLDSVPGGGAEVLVDRVRTAISPHKIPTDTWLDVMRVAHGLGMKTTATMMFGSLDTPRRARRAPAPHPRPAGRDRAASPPSSRGRSRPATRTCRPATSPPPASTT